MYYNKSKVRILKTTGYSIQSKLYIKFHHSSQEAASPIVTYQFSFNQTRKTNPSATVTTRQSIGRELCAVDILVDEAG